MLVIMDKGRPTNAANYQAHQSLGALTLPNHIGMVCFMFLKDFHNFKIYLFNKFYI